MFDDDEWAEMKAEEILQLFTLEDVLEMNDLTDLETLTILIQNGHIGQPERILEDIEDESQTEDGP